MKNKDEEIEEKIAELKTSVKKLIALVDTLKLLIPNSNVNQILRIQFTAELLKTHTFGAFHELEDNAYNHAKNIYS